MRSQLLAMLQMQEAMNRKVHEDWVAQGFAWYRALWVECAELLDHYGFKWWKQQQPDMEQVHLEIIDIWHFGMSALFAPGKPVEAIASEIETALAGWQPQGLELREAVEQLAGAALQSRGFSVTAFWELMTSSGMSFEQLYRGYVGKNVLNFFRQDHGYKQGTYRKLWGGREDNEHLVELAASLDAGSPRYKDELYQALQQRYQETA